MKDCTVLLADDSNDIRSYVASILSKSFNVVQVADGQAALEYALQSPPSLIVTDVMMPRLGTSSPCGAQGAGADLVASQTDEDCLLLCAPIRRRR